LSNLVIYTQGSRNTKTIFSSEYIKQKYPDIWGANIIPEFQKDALFLLAREYLVIDHGERLEHVNEVECQLCHQKFNLKIALFHFQDIHPTEYELICLSK